jgi:4-aminobutyrate aminotransferase
LKVPDIKIEPPGEKAKDIIAVDDKYIATSTKTAPVAAKKARGAIVEDVDGNIYVDFTSGVAVVNVGHCHPEVVEAVKKQAESLMHFAGTDFYYEVQSRLAKRLCGLVPGDFEKKAFFTNSGTESTECAIKLTRHHSGRKRFVAFMGAFHGRTMGSVSLTASKIVHRERYIPMVPGVTHIPYAYCYRCAYNMEYPSCGLWCAKILEERYFKSFLPPGEVAAIFFESLQGEGGYIVPPKGYIKELDRIAKEHGILMVDDEVQAAFGRTGKMFAIEHHDVIPDVMGLAKSMGSGIPIGASVFRAELDFDRQGAHSNTFGGNLVACAAALATLDIIEKEKLVERAERLGNEMHKRLEEMKSKYEIMGDNRGLGLMRVTEFVKDRETKEYAVKERDLIAELAYKRGLILLPCGTSGIRYIPPLVIEEEHLQAGLDVLEECIKDASK